MNDVVVNPFESNTIEKILSNGSRDVADDAHGQTLGSWPEPEDGDDYRVKTTPVKSEDLKFGSFLHDSSVSLTPLSSIYQSDISKFTEGLREPRIEAVKVN